MCGRYYIDGDTIEEVKKFTGHIENDIQNISKKIDIYPSASAPILIGKERNWKVVVHIWGFLGFQKKGVLFNARSETALEKRMFAESVKNRRCVIPVKGFYEWDNQKNKFIFTREDEDILFLAGFYKENRFVILTTEANKSLKDIHLRMPLILERKELEKWVFEQDRTEDILKKTPILLKKSAEYIQQDLNLERK